MFQLINQYIDQNDLIRQKEHFNKQNLQKSLHLLTTLRWLSALYSEQHENSTHNCSPLNQY